MRFGALRYVTIGTKLLVLSRKTWQELGNLCGATHLTGVSCRVMILLLTLLALTACGQLTEAHIPTTPIMLPRGFTRPSAIAWLLSGQLVLEGENEMWL